MEFSEVADDTLKIRASEQDVSDIKGLVAHAKTAIQNLPTHVGFGSEEVDQIQVNFDGRIISVSQQDIVRIRALINTIEAGFGMKTMGVSETRLMDINDQLRAICNQAWPVDMSDLEKSFELDQ